MKYLTTPLAVIVGIAGIIILAPAVPLVVISGLLLIVAAGIHKLGQRK